jgi:AcrR family transcriptional regulator
MLVPMEPANHGVADRRTALLDATVLEIARRGTRGLRVERVAEAAGVSVSLLYHYFDDRATLLRLALEHVGERARTYTAPAAGANGRAALAQRLLEEIQETEVVRVNSAAWGELRGSAVFEPHLRSTLASLAEAWVVEIAELLRAGRRDGSIPAEIDPDEAAVALTALVEGLSGRWLAGLLSADEARAHLVAGIDLILPGNAKMSPDAARHEPTSCTDDRVRRR